MRTLPLPHGGTLPVLGLGTWRMGESASARAAEVAAVRRAIDMGYHLIDTAEMYGEGGAETVVGTAIAEALRAGDVTRDALRVVSKVYPHNASHRGTPAACDRSRQRLGLDTIDLYLLHWRGAHPLAETVSAMEALVDAGRIAAWGVSNFDVSDMRELMQVAQGDRCAANQVYHSLGERGAEFALLPWLREHAMPLMAYSPIDQGTLAADDTLAAIGRARGLTAAQVALAWTLQQPGVMAIPKAVAESHQRENFDAAALTLTDEECRQIDERFPAPKKKKPLAMI